ILIGFRDYDSSPENVNLGRMSNLSIDYQEDPEIKPEVYVYPNPFENYVDFDIRMVNTSQVRLEIFTTTGVKVATLYDDVAEADELVKVKFDASDRRDNMFIYKLSTESEVITGKIVRQK
ncbi:MAG: T9SS type A sorting domain-containing protein, partial [Bacteroidales bacterium]